MAVGDFLGLFDDATTPARQCYLDDAYQVRLEQRLNQIDVLTFRIPRTGTNYSQLGSGRLVQLNSEFYVIDQLIDGRDSSGVFCEVNCSHYYRKLLGSINVNALVLAEHSATSALNDILAGAAPATGWTAGTIQPAGNSNLEIPAGQSVLASIFAWQVVYGGDLRFNSSNKTIDLLTSRGSSNGVQVRLGKNLLSLKRTRDYIGIANRVYPYGRNGMNLKAAGLVGDYHPANALYVNNAASEAEYGIRALRVDNANFIKVPGSATSTANVAARARLMAYAKLILDRRKVYTTTYELTWADLAKLGINAETVGLGDTIVVADEELGIDITTRVIELISYPLEPELGENNTGGAKNRNWRSSVRTGRMPNKPPAPRAAKMLAKTRKDKLVLSDSRDKRFITEADDPIAKLGLSGGFVYNGDGENEANAYLDDGATPDAPTGLTASATTASIFLSWTANPEVDIGKYNIYRSTSTGFTPVPADLLGTANTTAFTDPSPVIGTPYFYKITAIDRVGNESDPSSQATATVSTIASTALAIRSLQVSGLTLTNNSPGAGSVAWSACTVTWAGTNYSVTGSNTASKYILWEPTAATFTGSTQTLNGYIIIAINESGTGSTVWNNNGVFNVVDANLVAAHALTVDRLTTSKIVNLVDNFDFEYGTANVNGDVLGWTAASSGDDPKISTAGSKYGTRCCYLKSVADASCYIASNYIKVTPGRQYVLSGWLLPDGGGGSEVKLFYNKYDSARAFVATVYAGTKTTGTWERFSTTYTVPASGVEYIRVGVSVTTTTPNLDNYADYFEVYELATSVTIEDGGVKAVNIDATAVIGKTVGTADGDVRMTDTNGLMIKASAGLVDPQAVTAVDDPTAEVPHVRGALFFDTSTAADVMKLYAAHTDDVALDALGTVHVGAGSTAVDGAAPAAVKIGYGADNVYIGNSRGGVTPDPAPVWIGDDTTGSAVAFFGATPVTQRAHQPNPTDLATCITAINNILVILETYGLTATS